MKAKKAAPKKAVKKMANGGTVRPKTDGGMKPAPKTKPVVSRPTRARGANSTGPQVADPNYYLSSLPNWGNILEGMASMDAHRRAANGPYVDASGNTVPSRLPFPPNVGPRLARGGKVKAKKGKKKNAKG